MREDRIVPLLNEMTEIIHRWKLAQQFLTDVKTSIDTTDPANAKKAAALARLNALLDGEGEKIGAKDLTLFDEIFNATEPIEE